MTTKWICRKTNADPKKFPISGTTFSATCGVARRQELGQVPSTSPSVSPSSSPSVSPSRSPSRSPSSSPSASPSTSPSRSPSASPSTSPSDSPSISPSVSPTPISLRTSHVKKKTKLGPPPAVFSSLPPPARKKLLAAPIKERQQWLKKQGVQPIKMCKGKPQCNILDKIQCMGKAGKELKCSWKNTLTYSNEDITKIKLKNG
mgnify:CR=1 FL=1